MKLIFMGTPDFAVPVLRAIIRDGHDIGYVITQPDRSGNRGKVVFSPVKECALAEGIEVLQPEDVNSEEVLEKLRAYAPDAGIVVAYGQILKQELIDIPEKGIFNVHGSLLPKYRGASPIQQVILNGDEMTGVTIMKVEAGLDSGDMLAKAETPVARKDLNELHDELSEMGALLMSETLKKMERGEIEAVPQNDAEATYCTVIKKSDGKLDFSEPAMTLERKIRAFRPWPGAFFDLGKDRIKVWDATVTRKGSGAAPGTIVSADKNGINVSCGSDALMIKEIQVPGKKRTSVKDYLLGHSIESGTVI